MRIRPRWLAGRGASAAVAVLAVGAAGVAPAAAATGPVSAAPAAGTPQLVTTGTTTEQIRQVADCGGTMYAVGTFTQISGFNGTATQTFTRNNAFSFSDTAPYQVTAWNPNVNGEVNTIAFASGNCADAYIGGKFTQVGSTAVKNIAEINTTTGNVVPAFKSNASGQVETILAAKGHLLTGGFFKGINGSSTDPFYVSLNPSTGTDDGYLRLAVSGRYVYSGVKPNNTEVYNQQLSPGGSRVLVEGDFTKVGGVARQQIFMLNLGTASGTVTAWNSAQFSQFCADNRPFYIQAAAWSPDSTEVYIADTGKNPHLWDHSFPLTGLCSVVAAFPAAQRGSLAPDWVNYTGCDSLYSVAADASAVYVGGDERWADNARGCNHPGTGSVPAPGMGGFTPGASGGALLENAAHTAGRYSRARGLGADDMLLTGAGLWIASDNLKGSATCGGVTGHAGLCFLPYS
jgi:hypothetical protein